MSEYAIAHSFTRTLKHEAFFFGQSSQTFSPLLVVRRNVTLFALLEMDIHNESYQRFLAKVLIINREKKFGSQFQW